MGAGGANEALRQLFVIGVSRAARVAPQATAVAREHALSIIITRAAGAGHQPLLRTPCMSTPTLNGTAHPFPIDPGHLTGVE